MNLLAAHLDLAQGRFRLEARFTAPGDAITAVFGPSGAGKSTLLAALAGLRRAQGTLTWRGRALQGLAPHRRGFGLVFQEARLFPHLTARQNLTYARRRTRPARQLEKPLEVEDVAEFFDIVTLLDRPVSNLSGGEKGRVALARALVGAPDFLLLDEPFAALDGARRRAFINVLLRAHRRFGIPMMVVTHSIDAAAALATHMVALQEGRVVAEGPFAQAVLTPAFQALLDRRDIGAGLPPSLLAGGAVDDLQGLWLRADHVLIATEMPRKLSARNLLPGRVRRLEHEADGSVLVHFETGATTLLARLTPEAVRELDLAQEKTAWAVVKAHAV